MLGTRGYHPPGARGRVRKEREHESEGEKASGKEDDNCQVLFITCQREVQMLRCLDQVCDVCGSKESTGGVGTSRFPSIKTMTTYSTNLRLSSWMATK